MKKSPACRAVAVRLGIDQRRVLRLVQNLTEAGLVPSGYRRHDLSHRQLARIMIAAVVDNGLHYAAPTVTEIERLEGNGLQFGDWLENAVSGRVRLEGVLSVIFQPDPAAASVLTSATQLDFGERTNSPTTRITAISGDALRTLITDLQT
ncbi:MULTISPECIES: hypothetical protein [Bradyrhizobium]|uniref:hypothetical protein n=1 Tax=Bradyrhizobium TaxID=374 RepID=UPI0012BBA9E5|nr:MULTISPECIES: hypothetical protein [Bradyrhizobium]MCS3449570.1 hypothetical protein [Bradyrhizobium elkanii]MCS3559287.1 hypothetical protein [Bradyrhizobium elkanii]MCW2150867.1 hypothetical protein [Bradyrhizobium elkanii]MCW2359090.1 hypothetical protein [Bradyrhizobium elkanii]MCW2374598.1 hypothetical protein [Bradyrhizobium elkanii]